MASCLERNVSDERATSIAASPLQISQPNGRPGGPRRLVTSRNGDALSMPASMPASKVCTVPRARDGKRECQWRWISTTSLPTRRDPVRPFAERPARYCDIPNFRSNGGRKSEAAHDGFGRRPARDSLRQFGKLGSQSLHCGDAHCLQPENVVQQSLRPFRRCRVAASLLHLGHPLPLAMDTHVAERYVGFGYSEPFFKGCAEHFRTPFARQRLQYLPCRGGPLSGRRRPLGR